ncbi:hypothetical protein [Gordonia soli]|uniref:Twin-arginine translocation pathway signal n=1 Tax=Gordonia soli NBRC 108243 TaxID=1223545 RepID=M0QHQ9_9ACTN|nr:hypothetical protein [Gordonia soli]GAC68180.1 hypothetical protein GS4_14_00090 [Gordonia soli NBRC 108243]
MSEPTDTRPESEATSAEATETHEATTATEADTGDPDTGTGTGTDAGIEDTAVSETPRSDSDATADTDDSPSSPREGATRRSRLRRNAIPVGASVVAAAAVAAAITAYSTVHRSDAASPIAGPPDIVSAANDGTVALLSYSPKSLDADFAKAKTHLTGQFLTYYNEFTTKVVTPAATENNVETKAQVVRSAVSKVDGDDAQVLAFVNQSTTSKTKPDAELTSSSVRVSLHRVDGQWRISSFDPV